MTRRAVLLALGLLFAGGGQAAAQFFLAGGNKVQYRKLDWQVLSGPHVDVYYYPAEARLAGIALRYAEESYDGLARKFSHTVTTRIPLIVYASHADFEQTNILPFIPPDGLLGVTDFLKRRVTLPFRGNLAEFRHTLRHELVHAFQISLLYDRYDRAPRSAGLPLPLWFTEGLAELWSEGQDERDEMVLRDLVYTSRLPSLSQLAYLSGGIIYPIGGRVHQWLAENYGDWRVAVLYRELWRYESFDAAVKGVYGRSLDQLNAEFQADMRRSYYPAIDGRMSLSEQAERIARGAIKPGFAPNDSTGGDVVYATAPRGYMEVKARPLVGGKATVLLRSGRATTFQDLHAFDSRIDASRPGLLLFSSRHHDRDAVVVFDRARDEIVGRYQFPDLVSVVSPVWGPDGRWAVFSGLALNGQSDLYVVRFPEGDLERLTDDPYQDLDPSLSPDGRQVVFASDRTALGLEGAVNLFVYDLESRTIRQLTHGLWVDETPRWLESNRILFTSSRDGVLNAFSVDSTGDGRRETAAWTGVFDAAPVPGRDAWLVGGFEDLSLSVFLVAGDSAIRQQGFPAASPPPHSQWQWPDPESGPVTAADGYPYRRKYSVDFAAGEFAYVPRVATGQAFTVIASDLLSDHVMFASVSTYQGQEVKNLFENVSAQALYINQTHRLAWGAGAFRFRGNQYIGEFTPAYTEDSYGGFGLLRYPLTRFARLEAQMVVEHSDRVDFTLPVEEPRRVGWIVSHYLSFVHDNALWTTTGPIDGHYFAITAGTGTDISHARLDSYTAGVDGRQYFRLGAKSAFAFRALGFWSGGDRPERINIGGTLGIRGYPNYGYIIGSRAFMASGELRFPLLDYLVLGTPLTPFRFPEIQAALFADVGRAWYPDSEDRALIGSFGSSYRWAVVPGLVLRLDWGWRFSDRDYPGYGLDPADTEGSFVYLWVG
ncbi:MAG: hypothetical protein OEW17_02735, partial [Gemmatimonadota bacterium]|nr:hypothetical protein [Gemmatimonadota bacterium]